MNLSYKSLDSFISRQEKLLEWEQEEEKLISESTAFVVTLCQVETDIAGNYVVQVKDKNNSFKRSRIVIASGTCVSLQDDEKENPYSGVVRIVENKIITIVLKFLPFEWNTKASTDLKMCIIPDETTYKRYKYVRNDLSNEGLNRHCKKIVEVAFNGAEPSFQDLSQHKMFNNRLNQSQQDAVHFVLSTNNIACILGPPGTGKTTTVCEVIKQAVFNHRQRVLVVAPSNVAIDNIVERLDVGKKPKMVRLGHPARLMDSVLKYSVDYLMNHGDGSKVLSGIKKDMNTTFTAISKAKDRSQKYALWKEIKVLKKELRSRQKSAAEEIVNHSQVVLCTCSGAYSRVLRDAKFDLVVIDEAAQALEVACWLALIKGERAILAGDPFQLAPTVMSPKAEKEGLGVTLFERLYKHHKNNISKMLTIQYRMNSQIMQWSSDEFYEGELVADDSVADHLLCELPDVSEEETTLMPLFFIDTVNCGFVEYDDNGSKANKEEAEIVKKHFESLLEAGVKESDIGIISPYSAQVYLLRTLLGEEYPFVEINTVDAYQGREKEAIIMSLVRSNKKGDIGFLSDERRMNVGITRAKRHVCLVGDSITLSSNQFLDRLVSYLNSNADVRIGSDYM